MFRTLAKGASLLLLVTGALGAALWAASTDAVADSKAPPPAVAPKPAPASPGASSGAPAPAPAAPTAKTPADKDDSPATAPTGASPRTVDRPETLPLAALKKSLRVLAEGLPKELQRLDFDTKVQRLLEEANKEKPDTETLRTRIQEVCDTLDDLSGSWDKTVAEPVHGVRDSIGRVSASIRSHVTGEDAERLALKCQSLKEAQERRLEAEALRLKNESDPQARQRLLDRFGMLLKIRRDLERSFGGSGDPSEFHRQRAAAFAPVLLALQDLDGALDITRLRSEGLLLRMSLAREQLGLTGEILEVVGASKDIAAQLRALFGADGKEIGSHVAGISRQLEALDKSFDGIQGHASNELFSFSTDMTSSVARTPSIPPADLDREVEFWAKRAAAKDPLR